MPSSLSIEDHPAALCELWLHGLATKTNAWWTATGGTGPDLVHPINIAMHLCERAGIKTPGHITPGTLAAILGPTFLTDRKGLEDQARKYVTETATWRRIAATTGGDS